MKKTISLAVALGFCSSLALAATGNVDIYGTIHNNGYGIAQLGTFGGPYSLATGVSADGGVVVGSVGSISNQVLFNAVPIIPIREIHPDPSRAFIWWANGGEADLGTLGGQSSWAEDVSANGKVVVGSAETGSVLPQLFSLSPLPLPDIYIPHAFRWENGVMSDLGTLGGDSSSASGVSADGSVVTGSADLKTGGWHAFRWEAGVMTDLGTLGGGLSWANDISADGRVVVGMSNTVEIVLDDPNALGTSYDFYDLHAFRWKDGVMTDLGTGGGKWSAATGVSGDGSVVVGGIMLNEIVNVYGPIATYSSHAFRWADGVMTDLGTLGGTSSLANGISDDGRVVVGSADTAEEVSRAFRWTLTTGMQTVEDWLRDSGVAVAEDITLSATAVNSDGSVVVGQLQNGQAFIARGDSGLVSLGDVQDSLSGTARGGSLALTSTGTTLNGAHSRPLARRVGPGLKTFWLAGDWGRDDHGARDGDLGLAEFGLGHNFGPAQVNVSLGQTWAKQEQVLDGHTKTEGTYLLAEALIPLSGKLWAVLSGYGHWGEADIRRGYLNAGLPDASLGSPDVDTWGLRARLEADAAWRVAGADLSPYADLSYAESQLDAYIETGGGFPASFASRKEQATELRLGMNAVHPLGNRRYLLGLLEAAHRFEDNGAGTSGQVIGLFGFNLPGQKNQQNWLRAGLGVEGQLGGGTASLMFNATTQGETPSYWLAAGWQKAF